MGEVASAFVTLVPSAKGFGKGIAGQIGGDVDRSGKVAGKRFGGAMSTGIAGLGAKIFAPLAAVAGAAAIGGFFKDAVGQASDLNEAGTKITAIFGKDGAAAVQKFASGGAKALGQTKLQVLDATATFGTFGKAAGKTGPGLATFSSGLATLSTDLASFFNTSPDQAAEAIAAGLRGEAEPLRQYGVLLDDATLRQEALKQGLIKTTKQALTPQQKVLAAQAVIMKQTKDAQGDFQRTSGGLANQQRILSAQWSDMKATIGQALLPAVTSVVKFFNNSLMPALSKVGDFIGPIVTGFKSMFASGGEGQARLAPLVSFFQTQVIPAVMGIVNAVRGYIAVVLPIVQQFVAGMMARIQPLMPQIRVVFSTIGSIITGVMGLIQAIIERVTTVISFIWSRWGQGIMDFVAKAFGAVLNIVGGALKILAGIIKVVTSVIRGDWSGAWNGIKQIVSGAWQAIKGIVSLALNALQGTIKGAASLLKGAMTFVGDKVNEALSSLVSGMANKGRELIQGLIDGIMDKIQAVKDAAGKVAKAIKDFFPGSPVREGPLTSWNNGGAGKRLGGMLADGLTASKAQVRAASSGLAGSVAMDPSMSGSASQSPTGLIQSLQTALERATLSANISAGDVQRAAVAGYRS